MCKCNNCVVKIGEKNVSLKGVSSKTDKEKATIFFLPIIIAFL